MKKVVIGALAVFFGIAAQASTFDWKTYTGQKVYEMGDTTVTAVTAYLFDSAAVSMTDVVSSFASGSFNTLTSLDSATISSGTIAKKSDAFNWGATGDSLSAFFAVVVDDNIFISTIATGEAQASATTTLQFKGLSTPSKLAATEWSDGMTASTGWYTAVPEPTSGLLLLLGMAGLALKRKQA